MKNKEIKNVGDFNDLASDTVTWFMQSIIGDERYTREPTEDDIEDFGGIELSCIYTKKAMDMCERYVRRITTIGAKYFDQNEIEIITGVIEP